MQSTPNDIMPEAAKDVYHYARELHETVYKLLQALRAQMPAMPVEQLANVAYALRQSETFLDDIRKQCKGACEVAEKTACLKFLQDSTNMHRANIKTQYCTATPDTSVQASIPTIEKDPAGYASMMEFLGIDPMLWDAGEIETERGREHTEVVGVKWPGFQSLIARLQQHGLPLPAGVNPDKTFTLYKLRLRKTKGVLE